jgi:hypothetical protein
MIIGAHTILYSSDAEATRAALGEILGTRTVDAGGGWTIMALPPGEIAVHPAGGGGKAELYLMCDDLSGEVAGLEAKGFACVPVTDQGWGLLTSVSLPGGVELGLYEPRHPTAIG